MEDGAGVVGGHKGVAGLGCQGIQVDLVIDLHTGKSSTQSSLKSATAEHQSVMAVLCSMSLSPDIVVVYR